ncbi:MAG: hypothetical protein EOM23_00255 [Candidatus Moranbacteria bacterium]|nr:hypothetical protein [Candidatus Moranbacteria bacterium]
MIKIRFIYLLFFVLIFFVSSCAKISPLNFDDPEYVNVYEKNYSINEVKTAYTGESIVIFKNYFISNIKKPIANVSQKCTLTCLFHVVELNDKNDLNIIGESIIDNRKYYVLSIPSDNFILICITDQGFFDGKIINTHNAAINKNYKINPNNTRFIFKTEEKINKLKPFENFEIVYTGIDNNSIKILYREYSPDSLARTAFYQNLTYPIDSKFIRFKNTKIEVIDINNEQITYKVVEDKEFK